MRRRRPLQTCGASCVTIAQKACTKVQDLDGPLGSIAKSSATVFNSLFPFIYTMLYQWVAMISMIDDTILNVESKIESIFPKSTCLFDKIDKLVSNAEVLPEHLDDVLQKFPLMMHQFPLLDWILVHLISWLNFILSILTHWGSKNTREKDITVDVSCNNDIHDKAANSPVKSDPARNHAEAPRSVRFEEIEKSSYPSNENAIENHQEASKAVPSEVINLSVKRLHSWKTRIKALEEPLCAGDSPMYSSYQSANSSPVSDGSVEEKDETYACSQLGKGDNSMNCTYKEALERGKKEEGDEEENNVDEENDEGIVADKEHVECE